MTKLNERHVPVLFHEAIDFLRVRAGGTYVDCTLGLGGHAAGVMRVLGPAGHLIAFDRDAEALELATANLAVVSRELGSEAPWPTLAQAACSLTRRTEDLVFRQTARWICA
jgi:16S rRNA (cytosine1402-N4)-methyltransferase